MSIQRMPVRSWSGILLALMLSACGDDDQGATRSADSSYVEKFPALAQHMGMDEDDFQRFIHYASRGTSITPENIKSLSVGASLNSASSTYNLRPILDLGQMKNDSLIDVDTTQSEAKTTVSIESTKAASSSSNRLDKATALAVNIYGIKGGLEAHLSNAYQNAASDGTVNIRMTYANTGNTISVLSTGFTDTQNLTAYLIGKQLSEEDLQKFVKVSMDNEYPGCPHITDIVVSNYKYADAEPYANIQVLTRMQLTFEQLKKQYDKCSTPAIQAQLIGHMITLRRKISAAIADFYAFNGDSFVSKVSAMNEALGDGKLEFSSSSGSDESRYSAAASVKYSGFSLGGSVQASIDEYKQNGWANALKNVQVSAVSHPANVVDTSGWASSLQAMLEKESGSIVPPLATLPKDPGAKLPDPIELRKKPSEDPPESVFSSYSDWKQYQQDKKDEEDSKTLKKSHKIVDTGSADDWVHKNKEISLQASQTSFSDFYDELAELSAHARAENSGSLSEEGFGANIVRMENMYVVDFESTPYDAIIPQLRPNLDIPGQDKLIGSFPNIMTLMLYMEKLGRLDSYLRFIANLPVSNVPLEMSDRYHKFYLSAYEGGFNLISISLNQGQDLSDALLVNYMQKILGSNDQPTSSDLYKLLEDIDAWRYITGTLLDPHKGKVWQAAPGGYLPLSHNQSGTPGLVIWDQLNTNFWLNTGEDTAKDRSRFIEYKNPMANPLGLFKGQPIQTPWFPVYIYNQGKESTLVFMQHFGAYSSIYGSRWVVQPTNFPAETRPRKIKPSLQPINSEYRPLYTNDRNINSRLEAAITSPYNSFSNNVSWDYSLLFPASSSDPIRLERFNILVLPVGHRSEKLDCKDWKDCELYINNGYGSVASRYLINRDYSETNGRGTSYMMFNKSPYAPFRQSYAHPVLRMDTGNQVDLIEEYKTKDPGNFPETFVMLLPLNMATVGDELDSISAYAPPALSTDVTTGSSFNLVNKLGVLLH